MRCSGFPSGISVVQHDRMTIHPMTVQAQAVSVWMNAASR